MLNQNHICYTCVERSHHTPVSPPTMNWTLEDSWSYIENFRQHDVPSADDIVHLDIAMMAVLGPLDVETHCSRLGYSARFPRYQQAYPEMTPAEEIKALETHWRARVEDVRQLEALIDSKKREHRRNCTHEWSCDTEARSCRSRYICTKCGQCR